MQRDDNRQIYLNNSDTDFNNDCYLLRVPESILVEDILGLLDTRSIGSFGCTSKRGDQIYHAPFLANLRQQDLASHNLYKENDWKIVRDHYRNDDMEFYPELQEMQIREVRRQWKTDPKIQFNHESTLFKVNTQVIESLIVNFLGPCEKMHLAATCRKADAVVQNSKQQEIEERKQREYMSEFNLYLQ